MFNTESTLNFQAEILDIWAEILANCYFILVYNIILISIKIILIYTIDSLIVFPYKYLLQ